MSLPASPSGSPSISQDDTTMDMDMDMNMEMNITEPSTSTSSPSPSPSSSSPTSTPSPSKSTPRLMITKMVLENFKSYAGIKTIGPFHKCFSSVVGPNGSGKSNVIDAMLFVFGKRAKKLRLNKVSELIHSSTDHQHLNYAKVSVYFQEIIDHDVNSDGDSNGGDDAATREDNTKEDMDYTIVPNSEIVVSRVAKKDNSSQYKLNDKNCSFKQVATYLQSKGIDLDNNRFLILQGEVEMISMMPPKGKTEQDEGLLEYLEDIIGSNAYVEDTTLAEAKVEELTEMRQEKLHRVKALESEKNALEGAKLEAEALLQKERAIRRKQNILHQLSALACRREKEKQQTLHQELSHELNTERQALQETMQRVKDLEGGFAQQTQEYNEAHAQLVRTKEEFASYERRDIQLREEIKHDKDTLKKISAKVKKESTKELQAEEKAKEAQDTTIPQLEEQIEQLTSNKEEQDQKLEVIFEESKDVTEQLRKELEQKTSELAPVTEERAVFQAALDTAQTEVKLLEDSTSRAKERVQEAEEELASLDSKQEDMRRRMEECNRDIESSKCRIQEAQRDDAKLAQDEITLAKRHAEFTARAEESKAAMQNGMHRSKAVKGILKAAQDGNELHNIGILGRLGDLATIHEQYDVAISTSCGMLDHIVVRTTAGAQRCLQFLRKHNLGRANFIPLDKMRKGLHDRRVDTPENAPRLFDLISPSNPIITPALHLGVGDTLVAPDLETATRWAYEYGKRWRVVTMDGNLIELSGTMQGGGRTLRRGGMRLENQRRRSSGEGGMVDPLSDGSQEECDRLEAQAEQAQNQLKDCRDQRRRLAGEIRTLQRKIKELTVEIPKLSVKIASCDTTRAELTKQLPEMRQLCILSEDDAAKLVQLTQKVEQCKSDMASCAKLASTLEADVARLQKSILNAGGSKLKKQQKACDKALADLNEATKKLNSTKVLMTSSFKAAAKAKAAREAGETEFETGNVSLKEKKEQFKKLQEEAYEVHQAYEKVQALEAEKKEALQSVSKEVEGLKKTQGEMKCNEVELVAKLDGCEKTLKDIDAKQSHWKKQLEKLREAEEQDDDDDDDESDSDSEEEETRSSSNDGDGDGDLEMEDNTHDDREEPTKSKKRKYKKSSLPIFNEQALDQYDRDEVKEDIQTLENERKTMAKNANMAAIAEYKKKEEDYLLRVSELDKVTGERNEARKAHEDLRTQRLEMFMEGFGQITYKLKEMYQMITLGGDAELELVDSMDPFSEGIVFSVRPPKKSWKNISNLSGGEKTLSSLALVFALHHYKPTPLYVMDEIDAALDFKNVSIVANYIKERTKNAQFIIISLRNNMFDLADRLVGIYKTNNCTKSVTISPKAFSNKGTWKQAGPLSDRTNEGVSDEAM